MSSSLTSRTSNARVAQPGRGGVLKPRGVRVRISPRASAFDAGVYAKRRTRLDFQSSARRALRVRVPPPLPETFTLAVAQTCRAPRRERGRCGFDSRRPTQTRGARAGRGGRHAVLSSYTQTPPRLSSGLKHKGCAPDCRSGRCEFESRQSRQTLSVDGSSPSGSAFSALQAQTARALAS